MCLPLELCSEAAAEGATRFNLPLNHVTRMILKLLARNSAAEVIEAEAEHAKVNMSGAPSLSLSLVCEQSSVTDLLQRLILLLMLY